jgi:phage shock protein A
MALLERVSTLVRANLNDLIDKAEDPEKMIKQVILDIENQLIQVKTQVAVALADRHLLEKKRKEIEGKAAEWVQKAELAVDKEKDDLARAALERSLEHRQMAENIKAQETEQTAQADVLKSSLKTLADKLAEAQTKRDLLIARHRRARALRTAGETQAVAGEKLPVDPLDHTGDGLTRSEAMGRLKSELIADEVEIKLASLEKENQIDRLLSEIKTRRRPIV